MRGTIKVESDLSSMDSTAEVSFNYGIWAKNITINGSLSTKIILNSISTSQNRAFVGIYTENFVASELSSQISRSANGSDGFRGIGLNVNGTLSSYIKGDSFDFNGNIHLTEGYAIATNHTLNLRVSGTINVDNYWWADNLYGEWGYAIRAEHAASSLSNIVMIAKEKHDDIVEFSSTAKVNGIIDLYAGINQYFINSNAEITGNLRATNGAANIVFYLDNEQSNHATLNVTSVNDVTLYDSNTIVVNLNYAVEDVKYDLIKYDSTYGVEADSYWCAEDRNRQVSFVYQGVTKSFTLPSQIGQDTNNTFEINFSDNAFMRVVADYNRDTDTFSVTVTEISGNIPQVVAPFDDKSRKLQHLYI